MSFYVWLVAGSAAGAGLSPGVVPGGMFTEEIES